MLTLVCVIPSGFGFAFEFVFFTQNRLYLLCQWAIVFIIPGPKNTYADDTCFFFFFNTGIVVAHGISWVKRSIRVGAVAYATATTLNLSYIYELCHSFLKHLILNPLSEAKAQTWILTETTLDA